MCRSGVLTASAPSEREDAPWLSGPADAARGGEWFVLHVKSRNEKALAEELRFTSISHYLPLVNDVKYYGRRKARVDRPLFPGYVFLRGTVQEAYRANRTKRVARILRVANQQKLEFELTNLHLALSRRATLDLYPFLRTGLSVTVRAGPLRGLKGLIKDRTRRNRVILQVEMLGKAASLEIDAGLVDIVG
jgi:transcription antitermination factor NusG